MRLLKDKEGFTLVELSIVFVVIGLVAGAVLSGSTLINQAQIISQLGQIRQINTSISAFSLRYNCLPGDCALATTYFNSGAQPAQVRNGNGSGRIFGYVNNIINPWNDSSIEINSGWTLFNGNDGTGNRAEWSYVFDHLAASGVPSFAQYDETDFTNSNTPGVGYPLMKLRSKGSGPLFAANWNNGPGGIVVGYEPEGPNFSGIIPAGHKIRLGAAKCNPGAWAGNVMCFQAGLNPWEAEGIDRRIDDGLPYSGKMVVTNTSSIYNTTTDYGYCATAASNAYLTERNLGVWGGSEVMRYCAPSINADF